MNKRWKIDPLYGILLITILGAGCRPGDQVERSSESHSVEEMAFGDATCAFTGDTVETVRYGGRLEMSGGQSLDFMSIECLAGYYLGLNDRNQVRSLKVVDFTHGKRLLDVDQMVFLHSRLRPSPNGLFLTAIEAADEKMVSYIYNAYPGPLLDWDEVLLLVGDEWGIGTVAGMSGQESRTGGLQ